MTERIIIAGSGGQGVMLLGKVIAEAAMRTGYFITYLPAYGPEVRGGTSHCMVTISDTEIGSPQITTADSLIILNKPSLEKFKSKINKSGLMIVNSSLAGVPEQKNMDIKALPFTDLALSLGNIKVANMVALGAYLSKKKIIKTEVVLEVFNSMAPAGNKEILEINRKALLEGEKLANG